MKRPFALWVLAVAVAVGHPAAAQPPQPELMARVGAYALRFETLRKVASYDVDGKLESLDGAGHPDSTRTLRARVDSDGHKLTFSILRYEEDGQDKTAEALAKQRQAQAQSQSQRPGQNREWRMPFHPREQPRYRFDLLETDPRNPARVRVSFVPKIVEDDTIEGSAWIDTSTGGLLSAGFKLSRPPAIIDSVHVTMTFGENTSLGPAPTHIDVDASSQILFVHKRYHGVATLSHIRL